MKEEGPWVLDHSPEFLSQGDDVNHKIYPTKKETHPLELFNSQEDYT